MNCPVCKSTKTKSVSIVEEDADVVRIVCAEDNCGHILKESTVVERPDGTKHERQRRVKAELQPVVFDEPVEEKEKIKTAGELVLEALRKQEEAVGTESRAMALDIVNQCAEVALTGKHVYTIPDATNPDVLSMVFRELRNRGYRLKREENKLEVKWATKVPTKRKRKKPVGPDPDVQVMVQKQDQETRKQQAEAAQERRRKLKARSILPD